MTGRSAVHRHHPRRGKGRAGRRVLVQKTKTNPIGVAEYQLTDKLPKEFQGKLPSASELRMALLPEKWLPKQKPASKKAKRK